MGFLPPQPSPCSTPGQSSQKRSGPRRYDQTPTPAFMPRPVMESFPGQTYLKPIVDPLQPPAQPNERIDDFGAAQVLASFQQHPTKNVGDYGRAGAGHSTQEPYAPGSPAPDRDLAAVIDPLLRCPISNQGHDGTAKPSRTIGSDHDARPILPVPDALARAREVQVRQQAMQAQQAKYRQLQPARQQQQQRHAAPLPPPPSPARQEDPEPEFKTLFQFVVNEDAKEARRTVRKHVMREYRRRERWERGSTRAMQSKSVVSASPKRRKASKSSSSSASPADPTEASAMSPGITEPGEQSLVGGGGPRCFTSNPGSFDADGHREGNKQVMKLRQMGDPWLAVASSEVDPFSPFRLDNGPSTQKILNHRKCRAIPIFGFSSAVSTPPSDSFAVAWVSPSLMDQQVAGTIFKRIGWMYSCVAVHDPTPEHAILGFMLAHMARCRGEDEPRLAMVHKHKACQLITNRLADPIEAITDGSIGAIVNLAAFELADCNAEKYATHMSGIGQVLRSRGGMATLSNNPQLEDVIIR
jgi:hypothetical protein